MSENNRGIEKAAKKVIRTVIDPGNLTKLVGPTIRKAMKKGAYDAPHGYQKRKSTKK